MEDIMTSIKELRKTLDGKIESCITKEKAEKMIEDIINRVHPAASKAVLPATEETVKEKFSAFKRKNSAEQSKAWTSEYGRRLSCADGIFLPSYPYDERRQPHYADCKYTAYVLLEKANPQTTYKPSGRLGGGKRRKRYQQPYLRPT